LQLKGKAVRSFAAILILTSQIATAATVEGTVSNSVQNVPPLGTINPSALPTLKIQNNLNYTSPDGKSSPVQEEIYLVNATSEDELNKAEEFVRQGENETKAAGGLVANINFDGGDLSNPKEVSFDFEKALAGSPASTFAAENIPLRYDLKKSLKNVGLKYQEWKNRYAARQADFHPFKDITKLGKSSTKEGRDNQINVALTVFRFTSITAGPAYFAVTTSHVPIGASLPFAAAIATVSAGTQFINDIMPYNDNKLSFSTRLAAWYATELAFNALAQLGMASTNYFSHSNYFDLKPVSALLVTSFFAWASQGFFDTANFSLYSRNLVSRSTFNIATLFVSLVSVSLATSRTYQWANADFYFGWFVGGAITYATAVYFRLPERLVSLIKGTPLQLELKPTLAERCGGALGRLRSLVFR
jgi:hypothetical protein